MSDEKKPEFAVEDLDDKDLDSVSGGAETAADGCDGCVCCEACSTLDPSSV